MESDDGGYSAMLPRSPPSWMEQFPPHPVSISIPSTITVSHTGQLSPISNGMDIPRAHACEAASASASGSSGPSTAPTMIHSVSTSSTESWGMAYVGSDDMAGINNKSSDTDIQWEQAPDDILTMPKLEPLDDDEFHLDDVKEAPVTFVPSEGQEAIPVKAKRPRGRPRKHPLTPVVTTNKVAKGRSKTGCLTCRKRKKKCDEAKPRCKCPATPREFVPMF